MASPTPGGCRNGAAPPCRVLLDEDNELIRTGLRIVLDAQPDITVVGETTPGDDPAALRRRTRPDLVVGSRAGFGDLPVVVLCRDGSAEEVERAIRDGARGLLLCSDSARHVVEAVRAVAEGKGFVAPSLAGHVLDQLTLCLPAPRPEGTAAFDLLTARELEVLRLLASGLTTGQAAKAIHRSQATVKSHISHALAKLGLHDRTQAIAMAYQMGLMAGRT
ncbi:response regulator transcription factor [Saccharothrix variisporea]|uniref:DNA-binding NarL/FixJ family response regulator n=1 Tax=Saccharothrix variisporea TaxID=543527 RepID=A0A495XK62_9PSEU|nr:response regulator transcription factor [Saccharothrix variisporea]RKT74282.1 DNA-binding NarL/FixJ family response regulator [Saccharothrix variisporea]